MREEMASRQPSPTVKQDLANLNTDGDTRSIALKSLKLFVEQLNASTLPRFISQIAESREPAGTRSYTISLYEEVARVHGKLVVPHISKIMSALVKFSSASGSFPQLQLACARVTAAIARYSIDSDTFQEDAEKIIQEICGPLTDALAAKLEPVAASAAACIHAVVETEQWKYAQDEIVHEVCHRTTAALNEKSTRTVAHMQLVCVLASTNPDALSIHGASLLRAGEDTLKETANSWQLRKSAAKLLQSVLTILDKESLETELHSVLHVLESCRIDKMIHVRTAVSEALNIAKMLSSGNETDKSLGVAAERNGRSSWLSEDTTPFSPVSTRGTSPKASMGPRASRAISPSPVPRRGIVSPRASMSPIRAGTISPRTSMSPIRAGTISPRASMSPIRAGTISPRASMSPIRAGTISPRASMSPIRAGTISPMSPIRAGRSSPRAAGPDLRSSSPNLRAASPNSQESHRLFYSSASTSTSDSVQIPSGRSNDRSRAKRAPLYPSRGVNYAHSPRSTGTPATSPSSSTTTIEECESPSRRLLIAKGIVRSRSTGIYPDEHAAGRGDKYLRPPAPLISVASTPLLPTQLNALGIEFQDPKEAQVSKDFDTDATDSKDAQQESPSLPWLKLEGTNSMDQYSGLELATHDRAPTSSALSTSMETRRTNVGSARDAPNADVEVEKREVFTVDTPVYAQSSAAAGAEVDTLKKLARLSANLEEKTKSLGMAKDFISFVPPIRLVRSLSSLSNRELGGSYYEQDMKLSQDYLFRSNHADAAELDAETSSEAGWSVRNNPIASEESYISDSSDDEFDERRKADDFPRLRKVASLDATPREIHMISPDPKASRTIDDGATLDLADRACNPEEVHDACHVCPPCVLTEANTTSCKLRDPIQAKDMDGEKPAATNGLWDVVHKDNQYNDNICGDATKESNPNNPSPIRLQKQVDQGESGCYTVRTVKRHWKRLCWYTEAVLGGSLCVVLALPLAMVASKALSGSLDLQSLVPT